VGGPVTGAGDLVISPAAYINLTLSAGTVGFGTGLASCGGSFMMSGGGGGGGSRKEWQITNPTDTKVIKGRTYLKDGKTGLWWSRDTAGHGGSAWKVFKQGAGNTLQWIADADAQGNYITGKWKSPVGMTVRY
jgi:hypothetical protein